MTDDDRSYYEDLTQLAREMRDQLDGTTNEVSRWEVAGSSGGGEVTVTVGGDGRLLSAEVAPWAADPGNTGMLGDMIVAAVNDALDALSTQLREQLAPISDGAREIARGFESRIASRRGPSASARGGGGTVQPRFRNSEPPGR